MNRLYERFSINNLYNVKVGIFKKMTTINLLEVVIPYMDDGMYL